MFKKLALYFHTLKYLKFEQFFFRLKYRVFPLRQLSKPETKSRQVNQWGFEFPQVLEQSLWAEGHVRFLNRQAKITKASDWNSSEQDKLWLYNLHYFDDVNSKGAANRFELQKQFILRWIEENPAPNGNGWEPYPISLRLVNWVKWCQRNKEYDQRILQSIEQQAEALLKQLEFHILGNHLFANAKALTFVGCFLKVENSQKFMKKGLELLKRETKEQFLKDGGHFELSPMYHCILLWDLLDLYNLLQVSSNRQLEEQTAHWQHLIAKAITWLQGLCHPDGEISFFNDAAFGIAPRPQDIYKYAVLLGFNVANSQSKSITTFSESGYSRLQAGAFTLLFDHAAVGPTYLPGHAHADSLSFELSHGESRVFVNSGTSVYGVGEERRRQRSTLAHNTLVINDQDSSEVWGGFRVARRASITSSDFDLGEYTASVSATHDGYGRIRRGLTHSRTCRVSQNKVTITDKIGRSFNSAVAYFHLHPDVKIALTDLNKALLTLPSGDRLYFVANVDLAVELTTWHPEFGSSIPTHRLVAVLQTSELTCEINYG